jgi:CubicO group peptidase (beta-lactamase class C family)
MKTLLRLLAFVSMIQISSSQSLYFPPLTGSAWETVSPASLGWCVDKIDTLYSFLESRNTKAFLVLKDGRIAIERYFGTFNRDSIWYWASAGKTLTAFLTGIAQREGYLSLADTTSRYLGAGWTSCSPDKERLITVMHQLTMTSGLRDNVPDPYCTLPSCLLYQADAGTRWAYHNAPYTLLDTVLEAATGQNFNLYFANKIKLHTGMTGLWIRSGYNNVYVSNARSMGRFGLLMLGKGAWNADTLMRDTSYFRRMISTSQNFNLSYGYLWWLNGKASYMLPQTQFVFPGAWAPNAPRDMIAALGKDAQIINVVQSLGLVIVRMGEAPDSSYEVPTVFNNQIWQKLNQVICNQTAVKENITSHKFELLQNYPNPFNPSTLIRYSVRGSVFVRLKVFDVLGREVATLANDNRDPGTYTTLFDATGLASGVYIYRLSVLAPSAHAGEFVQQRKMMVVR